ncbi:2,3-bisphosphoglycerate-dependent phosphoglycerate mutase [Ligilactobacillus cholophilus]|uniref:2,3-bisphosphoglycerate-dependent phosphoglycerate mutase n=1 Tax=Ligilactobacillus cholophilus TaxID=3050131 RepID=UPI0025B0503C|nr:2,3-bisphosphoglycerate-dependent phosphoglycerate mutase [Ligilactobacillus cholophilus]
MVKLVLLRHGQSIANKKNEYTGWSDVPLTPLGEEQARAAGRLLKSTNIQFSDVHTSILVRVIKTANIVLEEINQLLIPEHKTWRLNERHYGALRGLNKDYTRKIYGKKQVALWRRSYYSIPPKLEQFDDDRRYQNIPHDLLPLSESLEMASNRILPYWNDEIAPRLKQGKNQLVVAHGSSLRALLKYLEKISDEGIDGVEVYNGEPIIYTLDDKTLDVVEKEVLSFND